MKSRVVGFHPIGFAGRPSRMEETVVIVDDAWGLIGQARSGGVAWAAAVPAEADAAIPNRRF